MQIGEYSQITKQNNQKKTKHCIELNQTTQQCRKKNVAKKLVLSTIALKLFTDSEHSN